MTHTPGTSGELRILLVGAHGHGRFHLANIRRLAQRLPLRLAGVCDSRPLTEELRALIGPVPFSASLADLLATTGADVTIVCTPIHTHVDLVLTAMRAGSHVLLEKPPAPTSREYERLREGAASAGTACQIGFQSLGSAAIAAVRSLIDDGAIGELRGIGATGAWVRDMSYYARAPWAGRRGLDGVSVVDGALTNPFAHAVASALAIDGSEAAGEVARVETDLYRAHPIDADDTSSLRLTTGRGTTITVAVTLCAAHERDPYVRVHGSLGRVTLWYKRDEVRLESDGVDETRAHPREDLLENLLDHVRDPGLPLLVPPERTGAFMQVVEAIGTGPDPTPIPEHHQETRGTGARQRRVVAGIDEAIEAAADRLALFRELDLPWATATEPTLPPETAREMEQS